MYNRRPDLVIIFAKRKPALYITSSVKCNQTRKNWIAFLPLHCIGTQCIAESHQLSPFYGIFNINDQHINLQKMPLRRIKEPLDNKELKELKLPKFGFRLKLTGFVSMLAWIGMIVSVFTGFGALTIFTTLIDYVRTGREICVQGGPKCFFSTGFGLFFALLSPYWFYLSFQLRKKVQEHDLAGLTKTLKAICYIQATFSVLLTGPLMVFPILKIIGMYRRRTAFVKIYIIFTIVMLILTYVLFIAISITMAAMSDFGTFFMYGVLLCAGWTMVYIYVNGHIVALHSIMEHNDNKFRFEMFKAKQSSVNN